MADNGYQILKVRTDCIPLSDRELKQIKADYDRNTLLYKKSKGTLKLSKTSKYDDSDGLSEPTKEPTVSPTAEPTVAPTVTPTAEPQWLRQ